MTQQFARLTDSQCDEIKRFLPIHRRRKHSLRDVFDAILWLTRTGCQWRNLDRQFPPWKVVHYYSSKGSHDGTLETINDALNRREREVVLGREPTPSLLLVDAQSIRLLPRIGRDRGMGGGKWINGRKRSILTDTLGRVWRVEVHAASVHDEGAGLDLIYPNFTGQLPRAKKLLADNAYTGQFARLMQELDSVSFECPVRDPCQRGFVVEAKRWVVERTFAWWNWYRRIFKDYERTVENSAGFVLMANIQMVLSPLAKFAP